MGVLKAVGCQIFGSENIKEFLEIEKQHSDKTITVIYDNECELPIRKNTFKCNLELSRLSQGIDELISILKNIDDNSIIYFLANSTSAVTGMVLACCVKSVKTMKKIKEMAEEGITEQEWTNSLIKETFETQKEEYEQFDVIRTLEEKLKDGNLGKLLVDKMIDICGERLNLRKNICNLKGLYETGSENRDNLKKETLEALELYFHLVCFGSYVREFGEKAYSKKFTEWLQERPFLAEMIQNGIRFWEDMTFFQLK